MNRPILYVDQARLFDHMTDEEAGTIIKALCKLSLATSAYNAKNKNLFKADSERNILLNDVYFAIRDRMDAD